MESPGSKRRAKRDENVSNLSSWEQLPDDQALVHTIDHTFLPSPFFNQPAEDVLNSMDVICMSLIDTKQIKAARSFAKANFLKTDDPDEYLKAYDCSFPYVFYEVGFIVEVPPENILGTFPEDVGFPNHTGTARVINGPPQRSDGYKLADEINTGEAIVGWPDVEGGYDSISTPSDILANTEIQPCGRWNEIQVVGKENIALHADGAFSKKLKIKKIVCLPKLYNEAYAIAIEEYLTHGFDDDFMKGVRMKTYMADKLRHEALEAAANKLSALNPGIPIEWIE